MINSIEEMGRTPVETPKEKSPEETLIERFKKINRKEGLRWENTKNGKGLFYKTDEVKIVGSNENDPSPAWIDIDPQTARLVIYLSDQVPNYLYVPVLEQTIEDYNRRINKKPGDDPYSFQDLCEIGLSHAQRLGVKEPFSKFNAEWEKRLEELKKEQKNN